MKKYIMKKFWAMPFFDNTKKEKIYYLVRRILLGEKYNAGNRDKDIYKQYTEQILKIPDSKNSKEYVPITDKPFERKADDPKLIAYYLPQFYPFKENDEWWGKGTTEWNNVSRAVPQFLGHYQPRLPGELGYYDLRLKENIERQVELAKLYGIYGFCYYYYWFDGKRLLDKPLDLFIDSKDIEFPFCLCWANEDWTRRFESTSGEVIMKQSRTVQSYENFIMNLQKYLTDKRYLKIANKKVLIVYQPAYIPNCKEVIQHWREYVKVSGWGELYLIAVKTPEDQNNYIIEGFDAITEFQPRNLANTMKVTDQIEFLSRQFYGTVYSYDDIVMKKEYLHHTNKLYKAVMPMWDNTARRNDKGTIFHGSSPRLYQEWLEDLIRQTKTREDIDDNMVFINAWNEWGEGTYLEPDRKYGYSYLQSTRNAIENNRT